MNHLSSKISHLNRTSNQISNGSKSESQLKANITTERSFSGMKSDRPNPPGLTHTCNHTSNTAAESENGSDPRREFVWLVVDFRVVSAETALEDEMISNGDTLVDGEPVTDKVHEVCQDGFVVGVTRDGNGDVNTGSDDGVDEARDFASPAGQHHESETDRVNVGAVVGDDRQGKDDDTELAESTQGTEENGSQKTTSTRLGIAGGIFVVTVVDSSGSHDSNTKHLDEQQREEQSNGGGEEDPEAAAVRGLVNRVVSSIASPTGSETIDCCTEGEDGTHLGRADFPGDVVEVSRMSKHS